MQKWEFCVLIGFSPKYSIETNCPRIIFFTVDGPKYSYLDKGHDDVPVKWRNKKEKEYVPAIIAEMGLQGWELVHVVECGDYHWFHYFKRQIES